MSWNEKIGLIKKCYPVEEFSVPHIDRKKILRQIETRFIRRSGDYYDLNNYNPRFSYWWSTIKSTLELTIASDYRTLLNAVINPNKARWMACEFSDGEILIYKSTLKAAINLIAIGQTWADAFHIVELKYQYLMSIRIEGNDTWIKVAENNEFKERVLATTLR